MTRRIDDLADRIRTAGLNRTRELDDLRAERNGKPGACYDKCETYFPSLRASGTVGRKMLANGEQRTTLRVPDRKLTLSFDSGQPTTLRVRTGGGPTRTYVARGDAIAIKHRGGGATITDRASIPAAHREVLSKFHLIEKESQVYRRSPAEAEWLEGVIRSKYQAQIDGHTAAIRSEARALLATTQQSFLSALGRRALAQEELVVIKGQVNWAYKSTRNYRLLSIDRKTGVPEIQRRAAQLLERSRRAERVMVREGVRLYAFATSERAACLTEKERADVLTSALRALTTCEAGFSALRGRLAKAKHEPHHRAALDAAMKEQGGTAVELTLGVALGRKAPIVFPGAKLLNGIGLLAHELEHVKAPVAQLEALKGGSGALAVVAEAFHKKGLAHALDGISAAAGAAATARKLRNVEHDSAASLGLKSAALGLELAAAVAERFSPAVGFVLEKLANAALWGAKKLENDPKQAETRDAGWLAR